MRTAAHLSQTGGRPISIGEVLKTLREEFSDISISKIRFLETEGLIEPERTQSGYRKFYPTDIARLRYILRLQRDHFMPLKVIRKRLEHFDPADVTEEGAKAPAVKEANGREEDSILFEGGLTLSTQEFLNATGMDFDDLNELEEYGLIDSHPLDSGEVFYDEDDLQIAKIAKEFSRFGIQPRHLRMYKNFAEKEVGLFGQVAFPVPRNNAADGRRSKNQSLAELAKLSRRLKHVLLRASLREAAER
ncbi:MAG: transcriptional regulator FtsR [Actinomycetota bacterium]